MPTSKYRSDSLKVLDFDSDITVYPYFADLLVNKAKLSGTPSMEIGARGMIGKGERLPEVVEAMKKHSGVYFGAIGGAGALLAGCIKKCELIAYEDLGAEALRKLYVEDMPLVVIMDSEGNNLYKTGRQAYLEREM